jgi:hypothetical protein
MHVSKQAFLYTDLSRLSLSLSHAAPSALYMLFTRAALVVFADQTPTFKALLIVYKLSFCFPTGNTVIGDRFVSCD